MSSLGVFTALHEPSTFVETVAQSNTKNPSHLTQAWMPPLFKRDRPWSFHCSPSPAQVARRAWDPVRRNRINLSCIALGQAESTGYCCTPELVDKEFQSSARRVIRFRDLGCGRLYQPRACCLPGTGRYSGLAP